MDVSFEVLLWRWLSDTVINVFLRHTAVLFMAHVYMLYVSMYKSTTFLQPKIYAAKCETYI